MTLDVALDRHDALIDLALFRNVSLAHIEIQNIYERVGEMEARLGIDPDLPTDAIRRLAGLLA